ncbi:hypothetical protein [Actinoplanes siamensis]|uniref:Uncharacterized protein n=1 Tax=Actinoplanes siamensis TaxID=1223317 RepID=A0A919N5Y1_9ACTN|nr:hypothetical protein [Actinoplanes siamensis]GIF04961.1 hypothetical protein Asi03nite_24990 [Actinoplanes siamensis]
MTCGLAGMAITCAMLFCTVTGVYLYSARPRRRRRAWRIIRLVAGEPERLLGLWRHL